MKLYFGPGACSLAPHICLFESGLQFTGEKVDLRAKKYSGGDFREVNAKNGAVPVLEMDNGERLTECSVIMQYIADQKPESGLAPKWGTPERYRLMEWLNFIATELHKGFGPLWNPNMPAEAKELAKTVLFRQFDFVENHLKKNQFLMGAKFSVADAYLFTVVNWANFLKLDLSKWPSLLGFMERVSMRPAVRETLKAEGLLK